MYSDMQQFQRALRIVWTQYPQSHTPSHAINAITNKYSGSKGFVECILRSDSLCCANAADALTRPFGARVMYQSQQRHAKPLLQIRSLTAVFPYQDQSSFSSIHIQYFGALSGQRALSAIALRLAPALQEHVEVVRV
jgi:hypothetical protein